MTTITSDTSRKKTTKPAKKKQAKRAGVATPLVTTVVLSSGVRVLTGKALLKDMESYRKEVTSTPKSARDFLHRLGVITPTGRAKKLIRG